MLRELFILCILATSLLANGNKGSNGKGRGGGRPLPGHPRFEEKLVDYNSNDANNTVLRGFLVRPRSATSRSKKPAVIVFPAFTGRTEFDNEKARDLAQLGYVAFAADTYGRDYDVDGATVDENFAMMGAMLAARTTLLRDRIMAAWNFVNNLNYVDKDRIGSIGFCYGGLCTLDLARFDVGLKASVAFHPTYTNYPGANNFTRTSIQCHHGDEDPYATVDDVSNFLDEMRERGGDWQFNRYAHAQHAFTMYTVDAMQIPGASFNPIASNRSWDAMEKFLEDQVVLA